MAIDKVGRLFSEYNRPLRKSFLLVIFFTIYVLVIVSAPYHSLGFSEEILYEENFENTQAQGWVFTRGRWNVSNGVFTGDENSLAWYNVSKWQHALALHIRVCIMEAGSTLRIYYRISDDGRYYMGFHSDGAYLRKEPSFGILSQVEEELASYIMSHEEDVWYDIEIVGEREQVKVIENGRLKTYYKDSEPLLSGSITLETLDGSYVKVDDLYVIGPSYVSPELRPDLALQSLRYHILDNRYLEIMAKVENIGNDVAPESILVAEAPDWNTTISSINELPVNSTVYIVLTLEISDARRYASYHFDVTLDPDDRILELREDNNNRSINVNFSTMSPIIPAPSIVPVAVAGGTACASALWYLLQRRRLRESKSASQPDIFSDRPPREQWTIPPKDRIVNTGFSSLAQAEEPLCQRVPLAPGQSYYFWFEVGPPVPGSIEFKPEPLMVEFLPSEARLKVVLFAYENEIETFRGADIGQIQIMPDGKVKIVTRVESPNDIPPDSDLLDRRLFFNVRTPNKEGLFRLRCNIYYEQILIQSRLIQASVGFDQIRSDTPVLQSFVEYAMSKTLNPNYLVRMTPQKLSLMLNSSNGTHCLRIFGENDYKNDSCIDARTLESMVELVRGSLRKASWSDEEPWTEEKKYRYKDDCNLDLFREDIISFAIRGYRYWSKLVTQLAGPRPEVDKLRDMLRNPTTFEFAVKDKIDVAHLFPPALIYDHRLDTGLKRDDYSICSSFLEALEAPEPLEQTECFKGNCPSQGDDSVICPSGFWGFRHAIGSPLGSRFETNQEMLYEQAPELTISAYPFFRGWASHQQSLRALLPNIVWNYADTREDTLKILESTNPHMVYFYCHGGVKMNLPYIKVGSDEDMVITPDNLDSSDIYWGGPQPLIFINGCHTTSSDPKLAINFVEKFVITCNASGVIGTEITVFEELASSFAEELMHRFLLDGKPIGEAVREARLVLLKKGNPLGLVYNVYASPCLRLRAA